MSSSGSLSFWMSLTHFVPKFGFFFTIFTGSVLLFLNYFGAQKYFGNYKYLMTVFTMLGIVFATVEILVYPNVHNYKASLFFFSAEESFGLEGDWIRNIPLTIYTFVHASTMSLLSVQFIYRYWAIFDCRKLTYFNKSHCFIWVVYCSLFGCQYSLGSLYFFQRDQVTDGYFEQEILIGYNSKISYLPGLTILAYDPVDGSVRWSSILGILNACSMVNFQYSIMIYCGWSMHVQMEERMKTFSETLRKHHKQFFKTLVLQIAMPTIILFIPIFIIMILPVFNLNFSIPSGVMLCCFTLYPVTDSIIVMYVVSEYRVTAKRIKTVLFDSVKKLHAVRVDAVSGPASFATPCN